MSDTEDEPENYMPAPSWIRKEAEAWGFLKREFEMQAEIVRLTAENDSLKDQRLRLVRYLVYTSTTQPSSLDGAYADAVKIMGSNYPWPSLEWVAEKLEIYDRTAKEGVKTMIGSESLPPVTGEDLKRLRELCDMAIKSGHFGINLFARDVLRIVYECERLRALHVSGPPLGAGGPAPPVYPPQIPPKSPPSTTPPSPPVTPTPTPPGS